MFQKDVLQLDPGQHPMLHSHVSWLLERHFANAPVHPAANRQAWGTYADGMSHKMSSAVKMEG